MNSKRQCLTSFARTIAKSHTLDFRTYIRFVGCSNAKQFRSAHSDSALGAFCGQCARKCLRGLSTVRITAPADFCEVAAEFSQRLDLYHASRRFSRGHFALLNTMLVAGGFILYHIQSFVSSKG